MKSEEVVALLQSKLPLFTDRFSDVKSVTTLTNPSGNEALATTALSHGLAVGNITLVSGAESNINITSLTRTGIVGTVVSSTDHDLTNGLKTLTIAGATESEFNGTFNIINVDNRKTIRFTMIDSGATTATGTPVLVNAESAFRGYNGLQTVTTVPSSTTFTYDLTGSGLGDATGTITISDSIRISAGGSLERLIDAYTKQPEKVNWMFVVLGDVTASKSRNIENDGIDSLTRGQQGDRFRQQIIQPVTLYIFIPTANSLTSRQARDDAEELFPLICKSILFHNFDSGLSSPGSGTLIFTGHGFQGYNSAFYIHEYSFEQTSDLTFDDTVGPDVDVAFRDMELIMNQNTGTETFTADINLDDEALP